MVIGPILVEMLWSSAILAVVKELHVKHALSGRGADGIGGPAFTTAAGYTGVRFTVLETARCDEGKIEETAESHGDKFDSLVYAT